MKKTFKEKCKRFISTLLVSSLIVGLLGVQTLYTKAEGTEGVLSIRPFADKMAFMEGYSDGEFKPQQAITRREAIVAMANLLVDRADIQGVYTSDFTDISTQDQDYDVIAYMERCGFLPDFGANFSPEQAITRGEMEQMLEIESDNENKSETVTRGEAAKIFCEYIGKTTPINNPNMIEIINKCDA